MRKKSKLLVLAVLALTITSCSPTAQQVVTATQIYEERIVSTEPTPEVIGAIQETADLYHSLNLGDAAFWNDRSRGFGGSKQSPLTPAAEENLLCWSSDAWYD